MAYNLKELHLPDIRKLPYDLGFLTGVMIATVKASEYLAPAVEQLPIPYLKPVNLLKSLAVAGGIGAGVSSVSSSTAVKRKDWLLEKMKERATELGKDGLEKDLFDAGPLLAELEAEQANYKKTPKEWRPENEGKVLGELKEMTSDGKMLKFVEAYEDSFKTGMRKKAIETAEEIFHLAVPMAVSAYIGDPAAALTVMGSYFLIKQSWKSVFTHRNLIYKALLAAADDLSAAKDHAYSGLRKAGQAFTEIRQRIGTGYHQRLKCLKFGREKLLQDTVSFDAATFSASYLTGILAGGATKPVTIAAVAGGVRQGIVVNEGHFVDEFNPTLAASILYMAIVAPPALAEPVMTFGIRNYAPYLLYGFGTYALWTLALPIRKIVNKIASDYRAVARELEKEDDIATRSQNHVFDAEETQIEDILKEHSRGSDKYVEEAHFTYNGLAQPFYKLNIMPVERFTELGDCEEFAANLIRFNSLHGGENYVYKLPEKFRGVEKHLNGMVNVCYDYGCLIQKVKKTKDSLKPPIVYAPIG